MVALLAAASIALAGPPQAATVVPGVSFAGLRLGATAAQVRAAWGARHGVCNGCAHTTWYYNVRPFEPRGAGVELRNGRAVAFFTLWQPRGWRTTEGVRLGDLEQRVTEHYGVLLRVECGSYSALRLRRNGVETVFYIREGRVWGFGLSRAAVPPCR